MGEVTFEQFSVLDIRIGAIVKAEVPEWSHWVMKLTVDLGNDIGKRTVFAGIMKHYKPEEVEGKQAPFVVNLKPKRIGPAQENGEYNYSEGMMLMASPSTQSGTGGQASEEDEEYPVFLNVGKKVPNGTKVR